MKNIRKITTRLITLIILFSISTSCDEFLEETPTSFINPTTFFLTDSDAEAAVFACYDKIGSGKAGCYGWWRDWCMEILSDDFDCRPAATANDSRNVANYISLNNATAFMSSVYTTFTSSINTYSFAVAGIEGMDDFPTKDALIAEAKFLRGFGYFTLVRLFGRVPIIEEPLSGETAKILPRSESIDEVYDLIISDLTAGVENLPESHTLPGRATKWAAMTLLAKVHMTLGNWSEAATLAKDVIAQSPHILLPVYADIFRDDNENNAESIFEFQMIVGEEKANQVANWPRGIGPEGNDRFFQGPTWGGIYIASDDLLSEFEDGDVRRDLISTSYTKSDGTLIEFNADGAVANYPLKRVPSLFLEGVEACNNSSYNFIYLRLGDVYLMAAEAENEATGPAGALSYINAIRNRAGLPNLEDVNPSAASDQTAFRDAIMKERRTELYDERARIFDLFRWGNLIERINIARPDAVIQPHHTLWPIPISAINRNPGLVGDQNPGYTE